MKLSHAMHCEPRSLEHYEKSSKAQPNTYAARVKTIMYQGQKEEHRTKDRNEGKGEEHMLLIQKLK